MMNKQSNESFHVQLTAWGYRFLMAALLLGGILFFPIFPLPLSMVNLLVFLVGYLLLLTFLHQVYGACSIGSIRVSELILSQSLSNAIALTLLYAGCSLYDHHFHNVLPYFIILLVQTSFSFLWTFHANRIYFKHHQRPRTAIIYQTDELLQQLLQTPHFESKYDIRVLVKEPAQDIQELIPKIRDCQVVFTLGISSGLTNDIAKFCVERGLIGFLSPHLGHIIMAGAEYTPVFNLPIVKVYRAGKSKYRPVKRILDILFSLIAICLTSPIMLLTALAIKLEDHGSIFYRQTRLTRNAREFSILKFRSMHENAEEDGIARLASVDDTRITRVGRLIRSCRVDELPQLFNILRGDMSIVGPRPERPEIARQYEQNLPEFSLRLQVKAGLTGMAQVYGRYNTEPYNKLQMDLLYINQISFLTDLKLIMATVKILFVKESTAGVSTPPIPPATTAQEHLSEKSSA